MVYISSRVPHSGTHSRQLIQARTRKVLLSLTNKHKAVRSTIFGQSQLGSQRNKSLSLTMYYIEECAARSLCVLQDIKKNGAKVPQSYHPTLRSVWQKLVSLTLHWGVWDKNPWVSPHYMKECRAKVLKSQHITLRSVGRKSLSFNIRPSVLPQYTKEWGQKSLSLSKIRKRMWGQKSISPTTIYWGE